MENVLFSWCNQNKEWLEAICFIENVQRIYCNGSIQMKETHSWSQVQGRQERLSSSGNALKNVKRTMLSSISLNIPRSLECSYPWKEWVLLICSLAYLRYQTDQCPYRWQDILLSNLYDNVHRKWRCSIAICRFSGSQWYCPESVDRHSFLLLALENDP